MNDPRTDRAVEMFRALAALKLKRGGTIRGVPDGTAIRQPGKPELLLTWSAAADFSHECDEAENG